MNELVEFLRARLDEDAAELPDNLHLSWCERAQEYVYAGAPCDCGNPDRVLREIEAKRRLLEELRPLTAEADGIIWSEYSSHHGSEETLLALLALPYSDHPDYREDWRP